MRAGSAPGGAAGPPLPAQCRGLPARGAGEELASPHVWPSDGEQRGSDSGRGADAAVRPRQGPDTVGLRWTSFRFCKRPGTDAPTGLADYCPCGHAHLLCGCAAWKASRSQKPRDLLPTENQLSRRPGQTGQILGVCLLCPYLETTANRLTAGTWRGHRPPFGSESKNSKSPPGSGPLCR